MLTFYKASNNAAELLFKENMVSGHSSSSFLLILLNSLLVFLTFLASIKVKAVGC